MRIKDMTGLEIGNLKVVRFSHLDKNKLAYWECLCDCGNKKTILGSSLRRGTKSCGCLAARTVKKANSTHRMTKTRTYDIWRSMKSRCYYKKNIAYDRYSSRGIFVCDRWKTSFENFLEDMGEAPSGMTLDRIDNNKGYSPENCRWASMVEQNRNRKDTILIEHDGKTKCIQEWAELYGLEDTTLRLRLKRGWDFKKALETKPVDRKKKLYNYNGCSRGLKDWAELYGLHPEALRSRLRKGLTIQEALEMKNK